MRLLIGRDDLAHAAISAISACDPAISIERVNARPVHRGFRELVNGGSIDIGEVALITLLQAVAFGRPLGLIPVTALGRFQHHTLVTCKGLTVDDLPGATVGVRSWTQTTGVWVRGALTEQYGVNLRGVDWVVYEGGHVAGCTDPTWVRRAPEEAQLVSDLTEGRLDAAIIGNDLPPGTGAQPVLADPDDAALRWSRQAGCIPVNHVFATSLPFATSRPDLLRGVYTRLRAATAVDPMSPSGFDGLSGALAKAAAYALEQEILTQPLGLDAVSGPVRELLDPG